MEEQSKIEELEQKLKEKEEEYIRKYADLENFKKRLIKDKEEAIKFSNRNFAYDILTILDALYIAESMIESKSEKEGITNTIKKYKDVLKKHGIEEVKCKEFNSDEHQSIKLVESDEHEDGDVVDILQKGYTINGSLLRPAMVSVCKNS